MLYTDIYRIIADYLGTVNTLKYLDRVCMDSHGLIAKRQVNVLKRIVKKPQAHRYLEACRIGSLELILYFARTMNFADPMLYTYGALECLKLHKLEALDVLIKEGYLTKYNSKMLLTNACAYGHEALVYKLISIDTKFILDEVIFKAAVHNHILLVKFFWSYATPETRERLSYKQIIAHCISRRAEEVVMFLWDSIPGDIDECIVNAAWYNCMSLVKWFCDKYSYLHLNSALLGACHNGNVEMCQYLVAKGADIHCEGTIKRALESCNPEIIEYLEELGCDIRSYIKYDKIPDLEPEFAAYLERRYGLWIRGRVCLWLSTILCVISLVCLMIVVLFMLIGIPMIISF